MAMRGEDVQMEVQGVSAIANVVEGAVGPQAAVVKLLAVYDSSPPASQPIVPSNNPNPAQPSDPDTASTMAPLPAALASAHTDPAQSDGTTSGDQAQQSPPSETANKRKRETNNSASASAAVVASVSRSDGASTAPVHKKKKKSKKQRKKERKLWKQGVGAIARETDTPPEEGDNEPDVDPPPRDDSEDENEQQKEVQVKEMKPKKVVLAKEARWDDIPDWEGRGDCPLLDLPVEVLDRCFGLTKDLNARDYVALAGTCKFFRHHLTNTFFHELCYDRKIKDPTLRYSIYGWKTEFPPKPETNHGNTPFSRVVEPWRVPPTAPRKSQLRVKKKRSTPSRSTGPSSGPASYYVPRGDRSTWTEAQYIVYKEEKSAWKAKEKARRDAERAVAEANAERKRKKERPTIVVGYINRTVLAVVHGRFDGEPAVEEDDKGIPLPGQNGPKRTTPEPGAKWGSAADMELEDAGKKLWKSMLKRKASDLASGRSSATPGSTSKRSRLGKWVTPDTDTDADSETDEEPMPVESGDTKKVHDCGPSKYRSYAAKYVNEGRINRSDALCRFKVTEAQLITLKHYLLPAKMGGRRFSLAAVEALALRAHGGAAGHAAHVKQSEESSKRRTETKRANLKAKVEKAKADGTYVRPKKKVPVPPYAYYWRTDFCIDWYYDRRHDEDFDINDYEELVDLKKKGYLRFSDW